VGTKRDWTLRLLQLKPHWRRMGLRCRNPYLGSVQAGAPPPVVRHAPLGLFPLR